MLKLFFIYLFFGRKKIKFLFSCKKHADSVRLIHPSPRLIFLLRLLGSRCGASKAIVGDDHDGCYLAARRNGSKILPSGDDELSNVLSPDFCRRLILSSASVPTTNQEQRRRLRQITQRGRTGAPLEKEPNLIQKWT